MDCMENLVVSNEALPYILYQRTEYLKKHPVFAFLSLVGHIKPFYKLSIALKSTLFKESLKDVFARDMADEYATLVPHLPPTVSSILDIGCGVAGIDVLLARHYIQTPDIYLLDKTAIDPQVYYGFEQKGSVYNSLAVSVALLEQNGVASAKIHTQEATPDNRITLGDSFDLVISLISWGFHYPVETYLAEVYNKLAPGGILILDIREGTNGKEVLEKQFGNCTVIYHQGKVVRLLSKK